MTASTPPVDERRERPRVDAAQRVQRRGDPRGRVVGVDGRRAEARVVLGGRAHAAVAQARARTRRRASRRAPPSSRRCAARGRARCRGARRRRPARGPCSRRRRAASRAAARPSARACAGACATSRRRARRRAGDAPHRAALLVDHDDQRRAQPARPLDRLQAAHDVAHLRRRSARCARRGSRPAASPRAMRRRSAGGGTSPS